MGEVEVETLVEGEGFGVVIEGDVDLGARIAERVVLEPGDYFLLITDADSALYGARLEYCNSWAGRVGNLPQKETERHRFRQS